VSGDDDEEEEEVGMGGDLSGDEDVTQKMKKLDVDEVRWRKVHVFFQY
jgi:hypothetical protein